MFYTLYQQGYIIATFISFINVLCAGAMAQPVECLPNVCKGLSCE